MIRLQINTGPLFLNFSPITRFLYFSMMRSLVLQNSIPFRWNDDLEYLPEQGWDWAFEKGVEDFRNNIKPNALCGLQIAVKKEFQGKGLSTIIVKELIRMARINKICNFL